MKVILVALIIALGFGEYIIGNNNTNQISCNNKMPLNNINDSIIDIPDKTVKIWVEELYDTSKDREISIEEAKNITFLLLSSDRIGKDEVIRSLKGIEYMPYLNTLQVKGNEVRHLDVSNNKYLTELDCSFNNLKKLDVSNNKRLEWLECEENELTDLDLSENCRLHYLFCVFNKLKTLNVNNCRKLTYINCTGNKLKSIDLSENAELNSFLCLGNDFTSLDFTGNRLMEDLCCADCIKLERVDISRCHMLQKMDCSNTRLKTIDVSQNRALKQFYCDFNKYLDTIYVWKGFEPSKIKISLEETNACIVEK